MTGPMIVHQAPQRFRPFVASFPVRRNRPAISLTIARNGAPRFLDRAFSRRHLCAPGRRVGRPVAAQAASAGHPRPRRSRPRRAWRGVGDARNAGDHGRPLRRAERAARSLMARASGSARSTSASCPPAMCSDRRRSSSSMAASGWSCPAITSAGADPTCAPFVPVPCDIFITEATFGLPVFRHPDTGSEIDRLLHRLHADPSRCVLVGAYALGKAQRVIAELRGARASRPDLLSTARWSGCAGYTRSFGVAARRAAPCAGATKAEMRGHIVIAPPGALNDRWSRRLPDPGHGDGIGLDAGPPARPPAQRRAAADHFRPCRLGRADLHHPRSRAEGGVDHPRPRGGARSTGA